MERRTGILIAAAIGVILIVVAAQVFLAWRTSNEILQAFEIVNKGLDSTRLKLNDQHTPTRALFDPFVCNEMAEKADAIHAEAGSVSLDIDEFKENLALFAMDDTDGPDSVYGAEDRGLRLHGALLRYFDMAELVCANDSIDRLIDHHAGFMRDTPDAAEWRKHNFQGVPVAACQAILSKIEFDVASTEALVLNDLLARCNQATKR